MEGGVGFSVSQQAMWLTMTGRKNEVWGRDKGRDIKDSGRREKGEKERRACTEESQRDSVRLRHFHQLFVVFQELEQQLDQIARHSNKELWLFEPSAVVSAELPRANVDGEN